ncbi:Imm1 family immunity protein [Streptomyces sp. NRRL WC-3742]|uniref:Imm1 family immunity protein n=1 Tax=Streptomyces sp. NRRL WC-3742 TaxID=1463934 RepID=UPI0004C65BE5|nr:Imm1 family immunity protein [Streptomyces sp. NRRL WC-3742]
MRIKGLEVQFQPEHTRAPGQLSSADDVDSFIDALLNGRHDRNCAVVYSLDRPTLPSGYRDHELAVGVDRIARTGALTLADDENLVSKGTVDRGIGEYMLLGHVREFMPGSEIPIENVRQAVKEFLENGGRLPTCIEWQEEEF